MENNTRVRTEEQSHCLWLELTNKLEKSMVSLVVSSFKRRHWTIWDCIKKLSYHRAEMLVFCTPLITSWVYCVYWSNRNSCKSFGLWKLSPFKNVVAFCQPLSSQRLIFRVKHDHVYIRLIYFFCRSSRVWCKAWLPLCGISFIL